MDQTRLKSYLEIATNIAVLLVVIALLGSFAWSHLTPRTKILPDDGLRKGATFAELPGIDYKDTHHTLVVALSSKCDYCSDTLPFIRQLSKKAAETSHTTRIIAVFSDSEADVRKLTQEGLLNISVIYNTDFKSLKVAGTPSIVLVGSNGKVIDFWLGRPTKELQDQNNESYWRPTRLVRM